MHLKDCCTIIAGQSPESKYYNTDGIGLPFFQGKADFGELYPTIRVYCSQPTKVAEKDDILLSVRAPVGPTNLAPCRVCIGRGLTAIRPSEVLLTRYVLLFFRYLKIVGARTYCPITARFDGAQLNNGFSAMSISCFVFLLYRTQP